MRKRAGYKCNEKNISTLSERLNDLESVIDKQEQYFCWNGLLLNGLEEESNENTRECVIYVLSESMGETISIQDIDETYKLPGKKPNGKSWPVK